MDFNNKNILLLGYGKEGRASYSFVRNRYPGSKITISDRSNDIKLDEDVLNDLDRVFLGEDWLDGLNDTDVIIRSPGISFEIIKKFIVKNTRDILVTSATELFLIEHRQKVIGVTGTKGKSTTSSLITEVLLASGYKVLLVGNIGQPALESFDKSPDYFVYELSSYQLEELTVSPHISLFLNIYPEHLDHHGTFNSYLSSKSRIVSNQKVGDLAIVSSQVQELIEINLASQLVVYDKSKFKIMDDLILNQEGAIIFSQKNCKLRGSGNLKNILAVFSLADQLKLDLRIVEQVISKFVPLPHRLEIVGVRHGLTFVNDSISTVPQATINAMDAFRGEVRALILGGYDRGLDFSELAKEILKQQIPFLLLFKPSGERILNALKEQSKYLEINLPEAIFADNMEEAINMVFEKKLSSGVCLLSPASPSFGLFRNFEERGEMFSRLIK